VCTRVHIKELAALGIAETWHIQNPQTDVQMDLKPAGCCRTRSASVLTGPALRWPTALSQQQHSPASGGFWVMFPDLYHHIFINQSIHNLALFVFLLKAPF
jgi:hypothetical protein